MQAILATLTSALILLDNPDDGPNLPDHQTCFRSDVKPYKRPYTVLVEGNVGSGKSTFVDILASRDSRILPVPEPVEVWQNFSGTGVNLLDLMFRDGKRYSGAFQLASTYSRLKVASELSESKAVRIMERSIFSERYCFLEMMRRGPLSSAEYALMDRWFHFAIHHFHQFVQPDVLVYLRADVETLKAHIKKRGRPEEANMDPRFLLDVQKCHEDWLFYRNSSSVPAPKVIVLNSTLTLEQFTQEVIRRKDEIIPPDVFNNFE